mmetsp:Transcript_20325/g.19275  ORF Transcript_20325/g.19275 Transcript_20325/m.19275 type:complete len:218 (+) Transcript_20325:531-1184(+)
MLVFLEVVVDDDVDFEVLAYAADDGDEGAGELPVHSIIQHIEEDYGLVSDAHFVVAEELDEQLFDPLEGVLVVRDLGHEQGALDVLQQLDLLHLLPPSELLHELVEGLLIEWVFGDVGSHLLEAVGETLDALHLHLLGNHLALEVLLGGSLVELLVQALDIIVPNESLKVEVCLAIGLDGEVHEALLESEIMVLVLLFIRSGAQALGRRRLLDPIVF